MKNIFFYSLLVLVFSSFISSCHSVSNQNEMSVVCKLTDNKYAKGFEIDSVPGLIRVTVFNPWSEERVVLSRYYLGRHDSLADSVPADGRFIKIPLQRSAVTSGTHIGFLESLDQLDRIVGICYADRIYNDTICKRISEGKIADLEDPFMINFEKLIALKPNAIIASGYNQQDEYSHRMAQTGVPVVFVNEWMETSPLARAEWIKYMGVFFDCREQAGVVFDEVALAYEKLRAEASGNDKKASIMTGENFRGTWYMPGGNNWMATLFRDAGADYAYADTPEYGSLPLSTEEVLSRFKSADVWVNVNSSSLNELKAADNKHAFFKAFKTGNVYANSKRTKGLANDFWERGVMQPHLLLKDYICILNNSSDRSVDSSKLTFLERVD
ncbi:MAG: ABC transporter substrate-binding protein [Bacteroidales bacterium]